jgi:DNA end-binding protein Ku
VKEQELQLALRLIEQTASDAFHPERYEDAVKQRVLQAIERKAEGQAIEVQPVEPQGQVIDLMEALKASIEGKGAARKDAQASPAAAAPPAPPAPPRPAARDEEEEPAPARKGPQRAPRAPARAARTRSAFRK